VQDAIDGITAVQAAAPEILTLLFHARFTLADRACIEKQVLDLFGKLSSSQERSPGGLGRILVATQVIEQSLDLDFDAMVSDLAPIDLLIQRAGRLHRHDRGPRPQPLLEIVSPAPDDDAPANWYASLFERGAYVYQHPGHLWRTMRILEDAGALRLASANPRDLLHDVFDVADYPTSFDPQIAEWEGKCSAHKAIAAAQGLVISKGYSEQQRGFYDEARTPTRLGDETRVVRLAKWEGGQLTPWAEREANEARAWRMSEIQIRAAKAEARGTYAREIEKAAATIENSWAGRARTALLLPLVVEDGAWRGSLANGKGQTLPIGYHVDKGFQFLK
jgi:CRISPR-associated endonuclease/helicase Cas3